MDSPEVVPGPSGEVYTFHRSTVQSNLYRHPSSLDPHFRMLVPGFSPRER